MNKTTKAVAVLAGAVLLLPAPVYAQRRDNYHRDHRHHDDNHRGRNRGNDTAAGVALGVSVIAIAAAIAAKNNRKREERERSEAYGYGSSYGRNPYSPARDVNCYPQERRCYWRGRLTNEWTASQFGYDPYRRGY